MGQSDKGLKVLAHNGLEYDHAVGGDVMIAAVVSALEVRQVRGHRQPEEVLRVDFRVLSAALYGKAPALRQTVQLYVV